MSPYGVSGSRVLRSLFFELPVLVGGVFAASAVKISEKLASASDDGDDGIRTHDPLLAGQVLSQLSYTPTLVSTPFSSLLMNLSKLQDSLCPLKQPVGCQAHSKLNNKLFLVLHHLLTPSVETILLAQNSF